MTNESAESAESSNVKRTPPTPDEMRRHGLRKLADLHYTLGVRDQLAHRLRTEPMLAEPLAVDEHLQLLAVDTAILNLTASGICWEMHRALQAGADWPAIARALGKTDEHEPREMYAEWVESQAALWDRQVSDGRPPIGMPPHERAEARRYAQRPPDCEECDDAGCSACRSLPDHEPPAVVEHRQVAGWKGDEPGQCGVECSCGLTYDGLDTLAEAIALLAQHIAQPDQVPDTVVDPVDEPDEPDDPALRPLPVNDPRADDDRDQVDERDVVDDVPSWRDGGSGPGAPIAQAVAAELAVAAARKAPTAALPHRQPHTPEWWVTGSDESEPVTPIGPSVFDRARIHRTMAPASSPKPGA